MVFASICEHASSAYIFASTSSDQFSHASRQVSIAPLYKQNVLRKVTLPLSSANFANTFKLNGTIRYPFHLAYLQMLKILCCIRFCKIPYSNTVFIVKIAFYFTMLKLEDQWVLIIIRYPCTCAWANLSLIFPK